MGFIEEYEPLEDGNSNIILNGLVKVHITELPKKKSYRRGAMRVIEDSTANWRESNERHKLLQRFRQLADLTEEDFPVSEIEQANVTLETLVNLLITWLPIPIIEKQKLLEVNDLALRSEVVREFLRQEIEDMSVFEMINFIVPDNPRWN